MFVLFACNISFECSEGEVRGLFEGVAEVCGFRLIDKRDRDGCIKKRYAFIDFSSEEEMYETLDRTDKVELNGRPINVRVANKGRPQASREGADGGPVYGSGVVPRGTGPSDIITDL